MTTSRSDRCPTCHRRHTRTNDANRRYWLLLHAIADKVRPGGNAYSADTWHTYCKSRWLGCDDVALPNGKTLTIPRSTAALDVAEFGDYMDAVEAWAHERDVWLEDAVT
jgi:hypothetical protein